MKKFISLMIMCALLLTLVACSGENISEPQDSKTNSDSSQTTTASKTDENSPTSNTETPVVDEYNRYKKIVDHNIYVNYKKGRRDEAGLNSHLFYGSGKDIAMFAYSGSQYSGTLEGVFDLINDGSIPKKTIGLTDAKFKSSGSYPLVATKTENTSVGSIDCINFTGSVTDANGRVCYAYGYTFVMDGTACMLVGFVFTEDQTADEIAAISTEIDKMMATVRTEA